MKYIFTLLIVMTTLTSMAQEGKATTMKKTFHRTTSISQTIQADAATIWSLLTTSADFLRWNSTIVSLEGEIKKGEKIKLVSTLDPERSFKLSIKEFIPNQTLVWGDAMGSRTYTLEPKGDATLFTMSEKIGGPIFPLFANKIPSFDASFEQFVADLKKEAEAN